MTRRIWMESFDMLSIGLLSLICALTSGVFGFGADTPPVWTWEKGSFLIFLVLAAAAFLGGTMIKPSLVRQTLDENPATGF